MWAGWWRRRSVEERVSEEKQRIDEPKDDTVSIHICGGKTRRVCAPSPCAETKKDNGVHQGDHDSISIRVAASETRTVDIGREIEIETP